MSEAAYARLERATAGLQAPFAVVDLDALWANAADLERRAASKPIRLASKSVRCRALQQRVLARAGFRGTLAFTLPEALWLAREGVDDLLVAYPTADGDALRTLAEDGAAQRVTVMVDCVEHLQLIERALAGSKQKAPIRVCIDVDAGWPLLGGRIRVGAKRSPVRTPVHAAALARAIVARDGLALVAIMAYEAQIAGLGDAPPGRPLRAAAIHAMQSRSARELSQRRGAIVAAVEDVAARAGAALEFVNGGGTGSLESTA
ncbi:MAG TPA: alanine racemase, partial [Solirubrobacteraceae bacterium]|nr:alanine racemase [Solirubrobacteraceae bacterium]